jgi:phage I-like protein
VIERKKHGTAFLSAGITLSKEGKAPTEITLLKYGQNDSDYGPFMFDELAAALVMASFGSKGIPRLYADWNHEMVPKYPGERITREQGKASCSFVPEVRNGDLKATDIQWSESGRADVESGEYNLFSPAFAYDFDEAGVCRPRKLINFALVNMAGLNGIAPLIAAMAKAEEEKENQMDFEKLYNEIKPQLDAANARLKILEPASGEVVALSAAVGLRSDVASTERLSAIQSLVTLRSSVLKIAGQETSEQAITALQGLATLRASVLKITGQGSPEEAIAALSAMKVQADKTLTLEAKIEADTVAALRAELDGIWEGAISTGKLPPADKAEVERSLLDFTDGKVTAKVVSAAKTYVAKLTAKVKMEPTKQKPTGAGVLSPERIEIARQMGRNVAEIEAFEAKRLGQQT